MNKHAFSGIWNHFKDMSLIAIFIALLISISISIFALRNNNLQMVSLRNEVYSADEQNGNVETALNKLRSYVYSHMNTDLRAGSSSSGAPIQLVNRFNRAVAAEQARVAALNNATQVYADAQAKCEKSSLPLTVRAQCIQDYVAEYGNGIPQLNLPPKEFYTFDFVSPAWSPDLAGWSLVASIVLVLLLIIRLLSGLFVRWYLK